jgi:peptidoglycan/xylan/chitin deacetylase (PgdA/CDA1 family)
MRWLSGHGFHAVTPLELFDALERGRPLPPKPVLITFDDGYRDVLGKAAPVLHRLHMPAVAFVITDRISGPDPSFLTWGMLARLERLGVAVGSHTVSHRDLTTLSGADLATELGGSRRALERHLGHPVQWLAYPAGAEDAVVLAAARRAGYVLGLTTRPGTSQPADDPLELRRDEILDTTGVAGLAALLGG